MISEQSPECQSQMEKGLRNRLQQRLSGREQTGLCEAREEVSMARVEGGQGRLMRDREQGPGLWSLGLVGSWDSTAMAMGASGELCARE